jgi:hypothetical protein
MSPGGTGRKRAAERNSAAEQSSVAERTALRRPLRHCRAVLQHPP